MGDEQEVATPLRRRCRAQSPIPCVQLKLSPKGALDVSQTLRQATLAPVAHQTNGNSPASPLDRSALKLASSSAADTRRCGRPPWVSLVGVALILFSCCWPALKDHELSEMWRLTSTAFDSDVSSYSENISVGLAAQGDGIDSPQLEKEIVRADNDLEVQDEAPFEETTQAPPLLEQVKRALGCTSSRSAILDIMAGAPYEFGVGAMLGEAFYRLPRLAARAGAAGPAAAALETELRDMVLQLAAVGGGWPSALKQRILDSLVTDCDEAADGEIGASAHLELELDAEFTSNGATSSGWLHQGLLRAGAWAGLRTHQARAALHRSKPPAVVLGHGPPVLGDCFAVRGNASISVRLASASTANSGAIIHQVVIAQPPRWAVPNADSSPRRFSVYAEAVDDSDDNVGTATDFSGPYKLHLGSFEYLWASTARQTFQLNTPTAVKGLRFVFESPVETVRSMCIYRLRAFGVLQ